MLSFIFLILKKLHIIENSILLSLKFLIEQLECINTFKLHENHANFFSFFFHGESLKGILLIKKNFTNKDHRSGRADNQTEK